MSAEAFAAAERAITEEERIWEEEQRMAAEMMEEERRLQQADPPFKVTLGTMVDITAGAYLYHAHRYASRQKRIARLLSGKQWKTIIDIDTSRLYYYNADTDESRWEAPGVIARQHVVDLARIGGWGALPTSAVSALLGYLPPVEVGSAGRGDHMAAVLVNRAWLEIYDNDPAVAITVMPQIDTTSERAPGAAPPAADADAARSTLLTASGLRAALEQALEGQTLFLSAGRHVLDGGRADAPPLIVSKSIRLVGCADAELVVPGGIVWAAKCGVMEHVCVRRTVERRVESRDGKSKTVRPASAAAAAPPVAVSSSSTASSASPPRNRAVQQHGRAAGARAIELTPSKAAPFFQKRSREAAAAASDSSPHCFHYAGATMPGQVEAGGAQSSIVHLRHCSFDNSGGTGACVGCYVYGSPEIRVPILSSGGGGGGAEEESSTSLSSSVSASTVTQPLHTLIAIDCDVVHAPVHASGLSIGSSMVAALSDCGLHHNGGNGVTVLDGGALIARGSSIHDNRCVSVPLASLFLSLSHIVPRTPHIHFFLFFLPSSHLPFHSGRGVHMLDSQCSFILEENDIFANGHWCVDRGRSRSAARSSVEPTQVANRNNLYQPANATRQATHKAGLQRAMRVVVVDGGVKLKPPLARQRAQGTAPRVKKRPREGEVKSEGEGGAGSGAEGADAPKRARSDEGVSSAAAPAAPTAAATVAAAAPPLMPAAAWAPLAAGAPPLAAVVEEEFNDSD